MRDFILLFIFSYYVYCDHYAKCIPTNVKTYMPKNLILNRNDKTKQKLDPHIKQFQPHYLLHLKSNM